MTNEELRACFSLGVKVAEHVHGISRKHDDGKTDAIFDAIKAIANGELSLLDTPEEIIAQLPPPPAPLKLKIEKEFYDMMRISRENERVIAKMVLDALGE